MLRPLLLAAALASAAVAAPVPKVVKAQLLVVMPYAGPGVPRPDPSAPAPADPDVEHATNKRRLVLVNDDGSDPKPLTDGKSNADSPAWSPDGKRVAFSSDREGGGWQVFVMDADGKNVRQVTADKGQSFERHVQWAAEGKRLRYRLQGDGGDVKVMETEADDPAVASVVFTGSVPECSPDGKKMAVYLELPQPPGSVRQLGRTPVRLHVADADGRNAVPLSTGTDPAFGRPAWSPDGQRVVFGDRTGWKEPEELYAADADGRNLTKLTDFGGVCQYPAFAPDGKRLAFVRYKFDGKAEVVVSDADGKNPKAITRGVEPHRIGRPAWRPR